jgi:hypothetical protein
MKLSSLSTAINVWGLTPKEFKGHSSPLAKQWKLFQISGIIPVHSDLVSLSGGLWVLGITLKHPPVKASSSSSSSSSSSKKATSKSTPKNKPLALNSLPKRKRPTYQNEEESNQEINDDEEEEEEEFNGFDPLEDEDEDEDENIRSHAVKPKKPKKQKRSDSTSSSTASSSSFSSVRTEQDALQCVSCLSEPKRTVLHPCRHVCLCIACARKIFKCPVCQKDIEHFEEVWIS